MLPKKNSADSKLFLKSLEIWDRPEEQLFGTCLDSDVDVDNFIEHAFTSPSAGIVKI